MTDTNAGRAPLAPEGSFRERLFARQGRERLRLGCGSFVMLFVELALIRWTAENNVYLAFLTNFVLLASFLGIGAGFLRAGSSRSLLVLAPLGLAALVAFGLAFPVVLARLSGDHRLSGALGLPPLPQWVSLSVIFVLTAIVMFGIAQTVASSFRHFPPLEAYRLDILGGVAGIVVFTLLSVLELPPVAWGVVAALGLAALLRGRVRWWGYGGLAIVIALLAIESLAGHRYWSPYYKISTTENAASRSLSVTVNDVPHQTAYPVATLRRRQPWYFFAYRHVAPRRVRTVLILGAGTGNDVAVALSTGARHVDAVEIDPVLQHLGSLYHPNRPYQSNRVSVHIEDGRAFLEGTDRHYDLILFALPDSLTLLSGQSGNLRLENYLLTVEAMRAARGHLAVGGTFAMYNYYQPFLLNRYAGMLDTVYRSPPCVELGRPLSTRRQAVLTDTLAGSIRGCAHYWHGPRVAPATDDWPFAYLTRRSISPFYIRWLLAIAIASLLVVRAAGGPLRRLASDVDLAFIGAAFLLLETKNVVQFALLFGISWFVNSLVFVGILLSVLAAIEVTNRLRLPHPAVLYCALAAALAVAWLVPQESLLDLSPGPRFLAATAIAFTPIFIANLIFSQRFRASEASTTAFAANLLGAMLGGAAEYLALVTGYRFLLLAVACLYGAAFIAGRMPFVPRSA